MNSDTKISVIIPVYKVEPYLRQCLDSVVNQTYRNLEIIVIDDGSPDNCGAICDEYAAKDERITVIHKENGGLSAGWNDGIKFATGDWIAFVDSDDWIDKTYFEMLLGEASHTNKVDLIIAGSYYEERKNSTVECVSFLEPFLFEQGEGEEYLRIKVFTATDRKYPYDRMTYVWNKLYRASIIKDEAVSFDVEIRAGLGNDALFNYIVLGKAKTVCGECNIGYHYRIINTAGSRKYDPVRPESAHYVLDAFCHYMNIDGASPDLWEAFDKYSLVTIISNLDFTFFHEKNDESYHVTAKKIKKMKKMAHYHAAIYSKRNKYIKPKQRIIKLFLRLPWIWPLKLLYDVNKKLKKLVNS